MTGAAEVVLLTGEFPPFAGGVATYCARLAALLTEMGTPVAVVAPAAVGDQDFDAGQPFPVRRVRELPTAVGRLVARWLGLLATIRRHRPRILWAADWRPGVLVALAGVLTGRPFAVTTYGSEVLMTESSLLRRSLARWVFRRAAVVLAISRYTAELATGFGAPAEQVAVVPLGVDAAGGQLAEEAIERVRRRHGLEGRRVLLTLGRLTPRKGHDTVLRALPEILRWVPETVYLVAGTGEDRPRLEALAGELGVTDRVVFAGRVPEAEKAAYYRTADVFVLLSRREGFWVEGFGLVFLEAGAWERPVVGGRHGGVPEAVVDGETGLLVDPLDAGEAARAIVRLLTHPELARRLGQAGRLRVERQASWRRVAAETLAQLERTCRKKVA